MSKRTGGTTRTASPKSRRPAAAVPTLAQARARLAGARTTLDRMSQEEFDALVAIAGPAEDEMAGL